MVFSFRLRMGVPLAIPVWAAWCSFAVVASTVHAQLPGRSVLIKNVRILTMAGADIGKGSILITGDRIAKIGPSVKAPMFCKVFDGDGLTATPGLIDVWSALGRIDHAGKPDPTGTVWDAFDSYDRAAFREALANGVTTVYVTPGGGPGINARGAIVRLRPITGGGAGALVEDAGAISINFGSGQSAVARMKTFARIRGAFKKALEYRRSLEDYEEDLKEYLEKLEERKKKEAEEGEKKEDGKDVNGGDKKNGEKNGGAPPEKTPKPKDDGGKAAGAEFAHGAARALTADRSKRRDRKNGPKKDDPKENGADETGQENDKKDEEELTKPTKPDRDGGSEVLLEAIDHETVVRIEAHRSADLLNALDLADEFGLDIVLEGATDAALVAEALAKAEVAVVLGPPTQPMAFADNERRRFNPATASVLAEAHVPWLVGSGGADPKEARFVGLSAQLVAGQSSGDESWLATVTSRAADFLGLKRSGRLRAGMRADIVLWSGEPGDPGASVRRVYVGGRLTFKAKGAQDQGGGR